MGILRAVRNDENEQDLDRRNVELFIDVIKGSRVLLPISL